jgi:hypothetical protein
MHIFLLQKGPSKGTIAGNFKQAKRKASMAKQEYSNYQKKVIQNYYQHKDTIVLTRLQELVTDLYLSETPAKTKRLWQQVEKALDKLKIKPPVKARILESKDVQILAQNLNEWLKK